MSASEIVTRLQQALRAYQECATELREVRYGYEVVKARAAREITEAKGGVKGLGSNQGEQERTLAIELDLHEGYAAARIALARAEDADREARANLEVARAVVKLEAEYYE